MEVHNTDMSASASTPVEDSVFDMSAFRDAVSIDHQTGINRTVGENLHPELTLQGLDDNLVGLYYKLVRGLDLDELNALITACITNAKKTHDISPLVHLFVLVFQTRWTRGGKAEKLLSYQMFNCLTKFYPTIMIDLVKLYPHYGYWKDLLLLLEEMKKNPVPGIDYKPFNTMIWKLFAEQLQKDYSTLTHTPEGKTPQIEGFCGKWAPSEGDKYDKLLNAVSEICKIIYPELVGRNALQEKDKTTISKNWRCAKMQYRRMVTSLRAALEVPEVKMCANHWAELKFSRITSLCMNRKMKALLNEHLKVLPSSAEEKTGNRYPENPDRVASRQNLLDHIIEKGISGKQLLPHELVSKVFGQHNMSSAVRTVVNAQWDKVVLNCLEQIQTRVSELKAQGKDINIDMTNMVCMSDVSGSMSGTPMMVSIALGILISQIAPEAFRNIVMTFSGSPQWHKLPSDMTFTEKVQSLSRADWGGNTNFEAAMNLIIKVIKRHGLTAEQVPNLLIASDMQIDEARGGGYYGQNASPWATMYERIKAAFTAIGMPTPTIIFMNLRSGTVGFPTAADHEGTMLLSGWSPSVFKFLLSGEMEEEVEVVDKTTGKVTKVKKQTTPAEVVHKMLTEEGLNPVREIVENHYDTLKMF